MIRRLLLTAVALTLLLAACGGSGVVVDSTVLRSTSTTSGTIPPTTVTVTTTSTTTTSTTTTMAPTTTSTLAGIDVMIGPWEGDIVGVVGVQHDDVLNLRAGPGRGGPVTGTVEPMYEELVARGQTRLLPDGSLWINVDYEGEIGWVHLSYVAWIGAVDDATALVVAALGEYPTTNSMEEMGLMVAGVFAAADPASRIVMTVAPTMDGSGEMDDLGEVTYDVIGLGDDATLGYRLHVFGQVVSDGLSFHSVERTALCVRGATPDGLCI